MLLRGMKGLGLRNKERVEGGKRLLVSVNVVGSSGPLRFVAKEEDLVSEVIHAALKSYARQARLPHLGTHASNFLLYSSNSEDPYACTFCYPFSNILSFFIVYFHL